jgi:hypothetical protein
MMTEGAKRRNPPWSYDELVLAMDLYTRRGLPSARDPEVVELSAFLNSFQTEQSHATLVTLRNPNGVYLKLCNFREKDRPGHGMAHGNHLEHDVWDRFANNKEDLNREAMSIRGRRVPSTGVDGNRSKPSPDNRRAALIEAIKSLPISASDGPKEPTPLLMALIREAVELQVLITTSSSVVAESGASAVAVPNFAGPIGTMLGLLSDLTDLLHVHDRGAPKQSRQMELRPNPAGIRSVDARKLVIFPCGDPSSVRHFNRTVRRPVDLTGLSLDWNELSKVVPTDYALTRAHVWGVMPRDSGLNETRFRRCGVGDVALFTGNRKAFSAATIQAKLRSADLARALWHQDRSGNTWELVFLLSEPIELDLPYVQLNRALGYSSKFAFQAFFVLPEATSTRASKALELELGQLWA